MLLSLLVWYDMKMKTDHPHHLPSMKDIDYLLTRRHHTIPSMNDIDFIMDWSVDESNMMRMRKAYRKEAILRYLEKRKRRKWTRIRCFKKGK